MQWTRKAIILAIMAVGIGGALLSPAVNDMRATGATPAAATGPTEKDFMAVVQANCLSCHSVACKSVDDLLAKGWLKPGDPAASPMYKMIAPPRDAKHKMADKDQAVIHDFIQAFKPDPKLALARQAVALLDNKCYGCHNHGWATEAGKPNLSWGQDVPRMIKEGLIVPGSPDKSKLVSYIISGKHPAKGNAKTPTLDEAKAFVLWVQQGAADPKAPATSQPAK
jgi:hypothetical protein